RPDPTTSRRQGLRATTQARPATSLQRPDARAAPRCALAEAERFELPVACATAVFKTAAFDHSATPPWMEIVEGSEVSKGSGFETRSGAKPLPSTTRPRLRGWR